LRKYWLIFKSGKADEAEFWIPSLGPKILNQFIALRDKDGKYLGVLEYILDYSVLEQIAEDKKDAPKVWPIQIGGSEPIAVPGRECWTFNQPLLKAVSQPHGGSEMDERKRQKSGTSGIYEPIEIEEVTMPLFLTRASEGFQIGRHFSFSEKT